MKIETGSVWRHRASGDEYMRGAWIDSDDNEVGWYWKRLPYGIIAGSPRDTRPPRFFDEFELVGHVDDDGEIVYLEGGPPDAS